MNSDTDSATVLEEKATALRLELAAMQAKRQRLEEAILLRKQALNRLESRAIFALAPVLNSHEQK